MFAKTAIFILGLAAFANATPYPGTSHPFSVISPLTSVTAANLEVRHTGADIHARGCGMSKQCSEPASKAGPKPAPFVPKFTPTFVPKFKPSSGKRSFGVAEPAVPS